MSSLKEYWHSDKNNSFFFYCCCYDMFTLTISGYFWLSYGWTSLKTRQDKTTQKAPKNQATSQFSPDKPSVKSKIILSDVAHKPPVCGASGSGISTSYLSFWLSMVINNLKNFPFAIQKAESSHSASWSQWRIQCFQKPGKRGGINLCSF